MIHRGMLLIRSRQLLSRSRVTSGLGGEDTLAVLERVAELV